MYDTASILVIFGSILFILSVLGGGITVKEIQIPAIQSRVRVFLFPVSIIFIVAGVWLSRQSSQASVIPMVQPTFETEKSTSQPVLATETQPNDPFNCRVLSDDFGQISGWGDEKLDWGGWSHENGEYKVSLYGPNSLAKRCNFCDSFYQKDFRLSINARTQQPKGSWGIYFWGKDNIQYSFELDKDGNASIKQYDGFDSIILVVSK
jgi:hypothetical protein